MGKSWIALRREKCDCCPADEEEEEALMLLSKRVKPIIEKGEFFEERLEKQAESVALLMMLMN